MKEIQWCRDEDVMIHCDIILCVTKKSSSMFLVVTSSSSFQVRFCALLLILCLVLHLTCIYLILCLICSFSSVVVFPLRSDFCFWICYFQFSDSFVSDKVLSSVGVFLSDTLLLKTFLLHLVLCHAIWVQILVRSWQNKNKFDWLIDGTEHSNKLM